MFNVFNQFHIMLTDLLMTSSTYKPVILENDEFYPLNLILNTIVDIISFPPILWTLLVLFTLGCILMIIGIIKELVIDPIRGKSSPLDSSNLWWWYLGSGHNKD